MHCSTWSHYLGFTHQLHKARERPTEDGLHVGLSYDQPIIYSSAFKPFQHNKAQKRTYLDTATPETWFYYLFIDSTSLNTTSKVWKPHHLSSFVFKVFCDCFPCRRGPRPCGHHVAVCWMKWWVPGPWEGSSQVSGLVRGRFVSLPLRDTPHTHLPTPPTPAWCVSPVDKPSLSLGEG